MCFPLQKCKHDCFKHHDSQTFLELGETFINIGEKTYDFYKKKKRTVQENLRDYAKLDSKKGRLVYSPPKKIHTTPPSSRKCLKKTTQRPLDVRLPLCGEARTASAFTSKTVCGKERQGTRRKETSPATPSAAILEPRAMPTKQYEEVVTLVLHPQNS